MPNYEKAVIYRLCCKDPTITDEYIGSTVCKYRRKSQHKSRCHNENDSHYNSPVYQCIRANGGFENWDMIVLEEYPCGSKVELHQRERHWIEERRPTLNKLIPTRTNKEYKEDNKEKIRQYKKTKYICECGSELTIVHKNQHFKTHKHLKYLNELNNSAIIIQRFFKKYLNL